LTIANNATGTFLWTAPVTGNPNDTYAVTGFATANGPILTATATSTPIQDVDGYIATIGSTNAGSTNAELLWTVTNYACFNINQVVIAVPAGWTFGNDAYAVVNNTAGNAVDTWSPAAGTTFTSPNATDRIPPAGNTGVFSLLFSQTPAAPGNYVFNVSITDDAATPVTRIIPTTVTVAPYDSSTPGEANFTGTGIWHEDIR
jgi:hypothetical protein